MSDDDTDGEDAPVATCEDEGHRKSAFYHHGRLYVVEPSDGAVIGAEKGGRHRLAAEVT